MDAYLAAPDQPSPEALPLAVEEEPLPVIETQQDYPVGVQRVAKALVRAARAAAPGAARKKKREMPDDWHAKKRMLFLCLLLLLANICVGTYLLLTWK